MQRGIPARPSKIFTEYPDSTRSILQVQEMINPGVFENIKKALTPLMRYVEVNLFKMILSCKRSLYFQDGTTKVPL